MSEDAKTAKEQAAICRDIVTKKMVIEPKDTEVVEKFFEHFNLDMPKALKSSLKEFKKNPCIDTQKRFVLEVNRAISGEHSIDSLDEMFKPIVEFAKESVYELEFNDAVEETFGVNPEAQASDSEEPSDS